MPPAQDSRRLRRTGLNLRRLRRQADMYQWQVGDELGVDQRTVSSWEQGRCLPGAGAVLHLAEVLDCAPFEIDPELDIPLPVDLMQLIFEWPAMTRRQRGAVLRAIKEALS